MSDPLSPRAPRKGKIVNIRIKFLDDTVHVFQVPVKDIGRSLWEAAVHHLQLVESDYFGLQYEDSHGLKCWLDNEKPVLKQLPSPDSPLEFLVKFYTPDPGMLEEYTRYLYSLQIKKDLANGSMVCSENTAALIASYIVQAEIGDFIIEEYRDYTYLKVLGPFVPNQTEDMLKKVAEYHKQHIGESPAEAEAGLLDTARKVETYGMKLCPARDHENVTLSLAIAHMGILVFQQFTRINTFSWAKIRKLSFKRKRFLIKLHPETYVSGQKGYYKDTVEFFFDSRDCCKNFWKKCLEHHAFFRCHRIKPVPRNKTRLVSHGSSFRYSGRTQKQLMSYVRENPITPQFQRSVSGRISSSRSTSVTPKIASKTMIHNTPDTNNSLASSGSHVVQMERVVSPGRSDHNDTQSMDSSLSGSHSLHSPKLDHVQRSREGTPGAEEEVDQERENNALRGASFIVTNSECLDTNSHILSANQNVHDNGNLVSVNPKFSGGGGGGGQDSLCANNGEISLVDNDISTGIRSRERNLSLDHSGNVSHLKDGKKVMFAEDVKDSSPPSETSDSSTEQKQITSQAGKFVITLNEEIPAGTCITVSVEMSPVKEIPNSLVENDSRTKMDTVDQCVVSANSHQDPVDHCEPSAASGSVEEDKSVMNTSPHGASPEADKNEVSSSDDLIEDIPYYLERRLYENNGADVQETTKSPPFIRRGRSSKKRRPTNMQIEHVKVYEGGSESRNESPVSGRSVSWDKVTSKSMSPSGRSVLSRSPSTGPRHSSKSSLERSPSCNRKLEIVNIHRLPPKDSFSSIDDTTSPTLERDVIRHIQTRGILSKSLSFRGEKDRKVKSPNLCKSSSFHGERDIRNKIPNGEVKFIGELHRKMSEIAGKKKLEEEKQDTCYKEIKLDEEKQNKCYKEEELMNKTEKDNKSVSHEVEETRTHKQEGARCEEMPVCLVQELSECIRQDLDQPSQAAAFLIQDKDPPSRMPNLKNITFSTFKPVDISTGPDSKPGSSGLRDSETDTKSDYGSLPSAKHADSKKPLEIQMQPGDVVFNPTNTKVKPVQSEVDQRDKFYGPQRPRKVSFHRERGYKYSFESVNDPPAFALVDHFDDLCHIDTARQGPSKSESTDVLDVLESLEDEDMVESDTSESCTSSLDSNGQSEHSSSDEESHKQDEFLKFAKSLADSGKETTKDSGVGVDEGLVRDLSQDDPGEEDKKAEEEKSVHNGRSSSDTLPVIPVSLTDSSLSSVESDSDRPPGSKRYSLDPLADLENPNVADVNTSFSDSSLEEDEECVTEQKGGFVIPTLTFSLPSSPDVSVGSPQGTNNEFGSSYC
ncbi:uncharacterized protein LOC133174690 isoform X1 [Saccostrea echinata]|uniref:uncharacterized protein LOC133174690 isoform X1 n=1 Tax=Saccostrea echinata TaxID=191078 RepID=UPI002A7FEE33|nr:uncharacterized protein LOC133174690 isoform X1 [Saccostrea echinata]XP_061165757.1 uncharacterized protein LOC133174690 isoform X1 [Saccostrea echinata]